MSINPLNNTSSIWSNATTALTGTPDSAAAFKPSTQPAKPTNTQVSQGTSGSATPFQTLSSNLQAVLLQMQSGQASQAASQTASLGQSPTGGVQGAKTHSHRPHQDPAADQPAGSALTAIA